jgi:hypothetical protein
MRRNLPSPRPATFPPPSPPTSLGIVRGFLGTMQPSDSSSACMPIVRLYHGLNERSDNCCSAIGARRRALRSSTMFGMATIAVGCCHVSGLLVQPFARLLALMWFARWVLITYMGSTPVTQKKVLPPRRPTDQHHAISTSATRDALRRVPLALALQWCAAAAAITPSPSLLSGSRARLRSILGGAMAGLIDAAVDHEA